MEKNSLSHKSFLINFSIFSIYLIPFANKVSFETFPILLLILSILVIFSDNIFIIKIDKIQKITGSLILFIILSYVYNLPSTDISFLDLIKYLIGPIIFMSSFKIIKYLNLRFIYYLSVFLILLYFVLKFKIPIFFEINCNLLEFFIARYDCSNFENLKNPFLVTPEPSYLALYLGFILLIINLFKNEKIYVKNSIKFLIIQILLTLIIYETHSRIGFIIIIILFLNYFFQYKKFKHILAILALLYSIFIFNIDSSRTLGRIILIKEEIKNENITKNLNFKHLVNQINKYEPTGAIRLLHNALSVYGFYKSNIIFGNGPGSYSKKWYNDYSNELNLHNALKTNEVIGKWDLKFKKQYAQNYFFSILHDGGLIVSIIFLYLIFLGFTNITKLNYKNNLSIFLYILLCLFYQSQITNPMPWLALSLLLYKKDQKLFMIDNKRYFR